MTLSRKIWLSALFAILLAADQITKFFVQAYFRLYESQEVIPGFFNITYILNPGAAFGILQNQSVLFRKVFFITSAVVACVLLIWLIYKESSFKLRTHAYTVIMAGAAGNVIDRIRMGKVVDFLDFYIKNYHWYTFNIADSCVTIGICLLLVDMAINSKWK